MKRLLTVLLFFISVTTLLAGGYDPYKIDPDFEKAIKPVLAGLDSGAGADAYANLVETFKSLSEKHPREWRGYYWEAFANIRKAELMSGEDKEYALAEAERLINRAEMFVKENTELYLLRAWMLHEKISLDPGTRQAKYGPDKKWYLDQAYMMDQGNPRYFFLKAKWNEKDTSEASKKETLRYYRSANILFTERPPGRYYAEPDWGRGETAVALGLMDPAMPVDIAAIAAQQMHQEAPPGEPIPESMQGAVLPESLIDENAGEIRLDSGSVPDGATKKSEFRLFGFSKPEKPSEDLSGGDDAGSSEKATSGSDRKSKGNSNKSSSKAKSGDELPVSIEDNPDNKKKKKSKKGKDEEPSSDSGKSKKSKKSKGKD